MKKWAGIVFCLMGAAYLGAASWAHAQSYPVRPIKVIVPIPSGTSTDVLVRMIAPSMGAALGQPVVVENRTGASGVIGAEAVARAAPDGYMIMFCSPSQVITAPLLLKSVPYDPFKDFTPISLVIEPVTVLLARPGLPVNTVAELVDYAKRNPGKLTYGSAGVSSVFHLIGEAINSSAGINMVHVPYKGVPPAMNDLMAGQIDVTFATVVSTRPFVAAGKMKRLAVLEGTRYPGLPDLPTVGEALPGFEKPPSWSSFFGPAGLPRPIVSRLHSEIIKAVNAQEVRTWVDNNGLSLIASTPEQLAARLKIGMEVYGRVIKSAGLKPE